MLNVADRARVARAHSPSRRFCATLTFCLGLGISAAIPAKLNAAEFEVVSAFTSPFYAPFVTPTMEGYDLSGIDIDFSDYRHIRMTGEIVPGDAEKLEAIVTEIEPDRFGDTILSMQSPGGNFAEALEIGDLLTRHGIGTYVGPGDYCLSACAFAFLGGNRMVLRNVLWEPWRNLHVEGTLGFHSPSLPGGVPIALLEGETGRATFAQIAAPTLENIRNLQSRAIRWELSNAFLFEILGRVGADEFVFVDRIHEAHQNKITVLTDGPQTYAGFGMIEAIQACHKVLGIMLWELNPSAPLLPFTAASDGILPDASFFDHARELVTGTPTDLGINAFKITTFVPGRGNPACLVEGLGSKWRVTADGDFPELSEYFAIDYGRPTRNQIVVDPYVVLGFGVPWTSLDDDHLFISSEDALFEDVPDKVMARAEAFDFCDAETGQTWSVICDHAVLHQSFKVLTAMVETMRENEPGTEDIHRVVSDDLGRLCRPSEAVEADPLASRMLAYCALAISQSHLNDTLRRWSAENRSEPG